MKFAFARQALDISGGPQRAGTEADGMHDYPDEGSGWRNRGVEGPRPDGVGGGDERYSQSGGSVLRELIYEDEEA